MWINKKKYITISAQKCSRIIIKKKKKKEKSIKRAGSVKNRSADLVESLLVKMLLSRLTILET